MPPIEENDDLAARAFTPIGSAPGAGPDPAAEAEAEQEAQTLAALEAGMRKVAFGLLKIVRGFVEKRLPEIREEWNDAVLQGPVDPLVGIVKKYLPKLMEGFGRYPEFGLLAFSMLPLVMGYMNAVERHELTVDAQPPEEPSSNFVNING